MAVNMHIAVCLGHNDLAFFWQQFVLVLDSASDVQWIYITITI